MPALDGGVFSRGLLEAFEKPADRDLQVQRRGCVLPFALPAAVLATSGGVLAWFARIQGWATLLAVVAVVGAWAWVGLQPWRARRDPARSTLITLGLATLLLGATLAWPRIEPLVLGLLRQR